VKESTLRFARDRRQPPAAGFDDRAADRQAQAHAHAHALGLGRVEGLEAASSRPRVVTIVSILMDAR
jgi:hypothetical protein